LSKEKMNSKEKSSLHKVGGRKKKIKLHIRQLENNYSV
jgi:hypothetical protein